MQAKLSPEFQVKLKDHFHRGNVSVQNHPTLPLHILNYTDQCTYDRAWDEVTKACRGLIIDHSFNIVARPFPKFFNVEEHDASDIPHEQPHVFTKEDGSLAILFRYNGHIEIATRGSFTSDQAVWATKQLKERYWGFAITGMKMLMDAGYTPLFEIIYPDNRVVVDYGPDEKLVLLGLMSNQEGASVPFVAPEPGMWPHVAARHEYTSLADLKALDLPNREGFVLYYPQSDFRVKVKFPTYVETHRKVFGLSTTWVWEAMENGTKHELTLLEGLPDEYMDWVETTGREYRLKALEIEKECRQDLADADPAWSRKQFAEYATQCAYPKILFLLYDDKSYQEAIWKLVKPKYAKANPYRRTPGIGEDNLGQATA